MDKEKTILRAWHDLGAPLRAIRLLVDLTDDGSEPLGPNTRQNLQMIVGRANRAESLLNQLLELVMLDVQPEPAQLADTREIVQEAVDNHRDNGFNLAVLGHWPEVLLPAKAFGSALDELLTNAIKHHGGTAGSIELTASCDGSILRVTVADDGKGIDARFHDDIFEFCKTLQSQDQIEGNGMGLTLIRETLARRGGTITVQSQPGRGARFTMDWPVPESDSSRSGR